MRHTTTYENILYRAKIREAKRKRKIMFIQKLFGLLMYLFSAIIYMINPAEMGDCIIFFTILGTVLLFSKKILLEGIL